MKEGAGTRGRRPGWRWAGWGLAGLVLTGLCLAGALLSWPAGEPREADAVVVLGGDGNLSLGRYARGRALVQAGYSRRLILFYPSADELRDARATVPEVVVVACMPAPSSWGEAQAVRERMLTDGVHSVLVVSDPPHMLRLDYTWGAVLGGTGLRYTLVATSPAWWPGWRWWMSPDAWGFVGSEVLKLGYYLLKYRFGLNVNGPDADSIFAASPATCSLPAKSCKSGSDSN